MATGIATVMREPKASMFDAIQARGFPMLLTVALPAITAVGETGKPIERRYVQASPSGRPFAAVHGGNDGATLGLSLGTKARPDMTEAETTTLPSPLRIAALDPQDLAILSAHLQDAEVKVRDMAYLPGQKRFVLVGDRFDWIGAGRGRCERCHTGLHFERVSRVRRAGFDQDPDAVLTLLAISFMPDTAPAGTVMLHFSNDGAIRLDVECVEAALSDIGPRRPCGNPPLREAVPGIASPS